MHANANLDMVSFQPFMQNPPRLVQEARKVSIISPRGRPPILRQRWASDSNRAALWRLLGLLIMLPLWRVVEDGYVLGCYPTNSHHQNHYISVEDPYKPLFAPLTRRGFESQDIWYHWYWFVLTHWSVVKLVYSKNWCFLHIHHQKYIKATWALMIPLQLSIRTWNVWAVSAISYQQTFTEGQFLMRFFQGFLQTLHLDMDKNEGKSGTRECSKINFWSRVVLDPHPYIYDAKTPLNASFYNLWLISNLWNGTDQCGNRWSQAGLHDFMQCLLMLRMLIVYSACLLFPTKILRKREKPERKIISSFLSFFLAFLLAFFSLSLDTSGWLGPSSELHVSYGKTVMCFTTGW